MNEKPNNRYVELFKNTGLLAIGNFSSKILVFLLVPLYTNVLSTSEYGLYDLFITTVQLLIPFFTLNVTDGVLRFTLENKENVNQVFRVALKFTVLGIIPAALIIVINNIGGFSVDLTTYGLYVLAYYISYMFNQFFIQFAKGIDKVSMMTISGVIGTLVTVIGCIVTLLVLGLGLKGFFYANIMGQLIPCVYLWFALRLWRYTTRPDDIVFDITLQKRLLAYSIPLIMTTVGWWLNNTSDRYVITAIKGVEVNGLLSVAYKIPSILTILYGIFIQAWQISAMKEYGKEDSKAFYNQVFVLLNLFTYVAASGLVIITRPLAHVAFAKGFYNAWIFVPYLILSAVFTSAAGYIAPILTSAYKTWDVAKSTLFGGLSNIVLNIVLLYKMGNIGVAVATAVSSFIILFMRYRSTDGMITKESFKRGCLLWILLITQATLEILKSELLQILIIFVALIINHKEIGIITSRVSNIIRRKRK